VLGIPRLGELAGLFLHDLGALNVDTKQPGLRHGCLNGS
jgi:hypothetical protein